MNHQVTHGLRGADAVVQAFADASIDFDAGLFKGYLDTYPEYSERLKSFAQVWLMSARATEADIAGQEISDAELLQAQSNLLMVWERALSDAPTEDEAEAARRLEQFSGISGMSELARAVFLQDSEPEYILLIEYLDPGLRGEPAWVPGRLAQRLKCPVGLVAPALLIHRQQQRAYSAKEKPVLPSIRSWSTAVADLSLSAERKAQLLKDAE